MKIIYLIGRVLFSWIFIMKSLDHFSDKMMAHAAEGGIPLPEIFVPLSGVLALLGGLSVMLGYKTRIGAWLLVVFLLPTTFAMHKFWASDDMMMMMMHQFCFLKNVSLMGTAFMLTYFGSGPFSLDRK